MSSLARLSHLEFGGPILHQHPTRRLAGAHNTAQHQELFPVFADVEVGSRVICVEFRANVEQFNGPLARSVSPPSIRTVIICFGLAVALRGHIFDRTREESDIVLFELPDR